MATLQAIIPEMTANNSPAPFVASASNQLASYAPFYAFQNNDDAWVSDVANSSIQIDLGRPYSVKRVFFTSINKTTAARMLSFQLQASKSGMDWVTVYTGSTTGYKFDMMRDYGTYRFWRIISGTMTDRGGVIAKFQLYHEDCGGLVDLTQNTLWANDGTVILSGKVYVDSSDKPVRISSFINDVLVDDEAEFSETHDIEFFFQPTQFTVGGNNIDIKMVNSAGKETVYTFLVYKLENQLSKFHPSSYTFSIRNTVEHPFLDPHISSSYMFDYMNSTDGLNFMFRYKPYNLVDSMIQQGESFAGRPDNENPLSNGDIKKGERPDQIGHLREQINADESTGGIVRALKNDTIKYGVRELLAIREVFDRWLDMNTKLIGHVDEGQLALRKINEAKEMISRTPLPSIRKQTLMNALTMMNSIEFTEKKVWSSVSSYLKAFERINQQHDVTIMSQIYRSIKDLRAKEDWQSLVATRPNIHDSFVAEGLNADIPIRHGRISEEPLHGTEIDRIGTISEVIHGSEMTRTAIVSEMLNIEKAYPHIGIVPDGFLNYDKADSSIGLILEQLNSDGNAGHDSVSREDMFANKLDRTKIFTVPDDIVYTSISSKDFWIVEDNRFTENGNMEAWNISDTYEFFDNGAMEANHIQEYEYVVKMPDQSTIVSAEPKYIDLMSKEARDSNRDMDLVDEMPKVGNLINVMQNIDKTSKQANDLGTGIRNLEKISKQFQDSDTLRLVEKIKKDMRIDESMFYFGKMQIQGNITNGASISMDNFFFDPLGREVSITESYIYTENMALEANDLLWNNELKVEDVMKEIITSDTFIPVEKMMRLIDTEEIISMADILDKASIIADNIQLFETTSKKAYDLHQGAMQAIKEEFIGKTLEQLQHAIAREKRSKIIEALLSDKPLIDSLITEALMNNTDRANNDKESYVGEASVSDKDSAAAYISQSVTVLRQSQEKDAIIQDDFLLAGDGGDWEDIFNRYSPGVDILDPPDADFNYASLKKDVYDPLTGVPYFPVGALNTPDVIVETPLHHPIPQHSTVGVDDTKRIAVDNYIFIDCLLALESLKNNGKLRFAGMPAGKAVQELFSSLYTWIQNAAPGHEQYERMFRFMRWYAEAIILRNSKHILHREYSSWMSSLHRGMDLGMPYIGVGWAYHSSTNTLDTTALSGLLTFTAENYVDANFIMRGYFDNPSGHGTMVVKVDGVIFDTITTHGVFVCRFPIPQGNHTYELFFTGVTGEVSISSIEIGGSVFISAYTTTDESDMNGLKALTELMSQLLGYYELHHGDGKIKGTMEVRQRAVWNTHT